MKHLAIFASGGGSNAQKIMEHFARHESVKVALVVSNRVDAGVIRIAEAFNVPSILINRTTFFQTENLLKTLDEFEIDFIALAGFLWLVPPYFVEKFEGRMVNIHPALLPKFGGKGMFGQHVHEAVRAAGETESGPTIHWVTKIFDEGATIFQARCPVLPTDSADDIARNVLALEHRFYPMVIEGLIEKFVKK